MVSPVPKARPLPELVRFGAALKRARLDRGLSQERLAERAGLHRTYVGSVERGERNLSLINVHALAAGLGMAAADLLARAEGAPEASDA